MRSFFLSAVILGCVGSGVLGGEYPVTYPYENEIYIPPDIPASTPSKTYDASDVGGYAYTYGIIYLTGHADYADTGYCLSGTGAIEHLLVVYGLSPVLAVEQWNCTLKGLWFSGKDFPGTVSGKSMEKICQVGQCCSQYHGLVKYADDQLEKQSVLDNLAGGGLCDEMGNEALYCDAIDGNWRANCYERHLSPSERLVTSPCIDVYMNYWLNCPVIVATGMNWGLDWEPSIYDDMLNDEQALFLEQCLNLDHVCHPYSYYNPDSQSDTSAPSDASPAASDDGTSAGNMFSVFCLFISSGLLI